MHGNSCLNAFLMRGSWSSIKRTLFAGILAFGFVVGHVGCDSGSTKPKSGVSENAPMSEKYPGPWRESFDLGITRALVKARARNCGEYYYRQHADGSSEYLVYGTSDGRNWSCYLVWPKIEEAMGPYSPDPSIPLPYEPKPEKGKRKTTRS